MSSSQQQQYDHAQTSIALQAHTRLLTPFSTRFEAQQAKGVNTFSIKEESYSIPYPHMKHSNIVTSHFHTLKASAMWWRQLKKHSCSYFHCNTNLHLVIWRCMCQIQPCTVMRHMEQTFQGSEIFVMQLLNLSSQKGNALNTKKKKPYRPTMQCFCQTIQNFNVCKSTMTRKRSKQISWRWNEKEMLQQLRNEFFAF